MQLLIAKPQQSRLRSLIKSRLSIIVVEFNRTGFNEGFL
jgi:hypothetical protein